MNNTEKAFLDFLADDIEKHPENVKPISKDFWDRAKELTSGMEDIDLDEPLEDDDET